VGVTTQADGTLALDGAKFDAAVAANADGVTRLFAPGGPAAAVSAAIARYTDDGGMLEDRTGSLTKRLSDVDKQRTALDARMSAMETRYRTQFAALDALIGKMRTTSTYLTQQLAALPGAG
jgi:flagellar hook-associated protein 2